MKSGSVERLGYMTSVPDRRRCISSKTHNGPRFRGPDDRGDLCLYVAYLDCVHGSRFPVVPREQRNNGSEIIRRRE